MNEPIRSKDNLKIKKIKQLERNKGRKTMGLFLVEGPIVILESLKFQRPLEIYHYYNKGLEKKYPDLFRVLNKYSIPVYPVMKELLKPFMATENSQGILGIYAKKAETIIDDTIGGPIVYLDEISDPGNVGGIIRSVDAFGGKGVIASKNCADIYNPKTIRSSMASIFRVPLFTDNEDNYLKKIKEAGFTILGTDIEGGVPLSEIKWNKKSVLIMGNEAHGMRKETKILCDKKIFIPMNSLVNSLNVNVAASICLYDAYVRG